MKIMSRRRFVAAAGGAGVGAWTGRSPRRVLGANDRILLGVIGSGGRGRSLMTAFNKIPNVEFIGVSDVYERNLNLGLKLAREGAKSTYDYRELLDNKDIAAVVIATPDHWHARMLIESVQAGKDVYVEKPFSLSIEQGAKMVRAVRATKQVVQVGIQRRSSEAVRNAKKLVEEGALGQVVLARAQWYWNRASIPRTAALQGQLDWERFQGPAKNRRPLTEVRFLYWRNFWDYSGGHMTDQGTHLMDVIQWFCNDGRPPRSAVCQGATLINDGAEVPDTFTAVFEYPAFLATWTLCYGNSYQDSWKIIIQGRKATMELDDDGYRIYPEPWRRPNIPPKPVHEYKGGIPTDPHVQNFRECMRSRQEPNAPVEVGHMAVTGPHLANLAFLQKKRAVLTQDGASARV